MAPMSAGSDKATLNEPQSLAAASPVAPSLPPTAPQAGNDLATVIAPAVVLSGRGLDSPPLALGTDRQEQTAVALSTAQESGPTTSADLRALDAILQQWDQPYGRKARDSSSDDETADGLFGRGEIDWFLDGDDLI